MALVRWIGLLEPSRDLLRRPPRAQLISHNAWQYSVLDQLAALWAVRSLPRGLVGLARTVPLRLPLRLISRLMVDGARPSRAAVERIDSPATIAREISSRSAKVNAVVARRRPAGRNPPVSAKNLWTDVFPGQRACQSRVASSLVSSAPTSVPSGLLNRISVAVVSFATLLLLAQSVVCCIDRLNPPPGNGH